MAIVEICWGLWAPESICHRPRICQRPLRLSQIRAIRAKLDFQNHTKFLRIPFTGSKEKGRLRTFPDLPDPTGLGEEGGFGAVAQRLLRRQLLTAEVSTALSPKISLPLHLVILYSILFSNEQEIIDFDMSVSVNSFVTWR